MDKFFANRVETGRGISFFRFQALNFRLCSRYTLRGNSRQRPVRMGHGLTRLQVRRESVLELRPLLVDEPVEFRAHNHHHPIRS